VPALRLRIQAARSKREVSILVVGIAARPSKRALKAGPVAKLVGSLRDRAPDDRRVQLESVGELEMYRLALDRFQIHRRSTA